jgi:hypothetical protein
VVSSTLENLTMNRNVLSAVALAAVLVLGFVWLGAQPAAQGQKPEKVQQWEYKILRPTDAEFANGQAEAVFNKLAADGWEFVEPIVSRAPLPQNLAGHPDRSLQATTCVLFKRVKK